MTQLQVYQWAVGVLLKARGTDGEDDADDATLTLWRGLSWGEREAATKWHEERNKAAEAAKEGEG